MRRLVQFGFANPVRKRLRRHVHRPVAGRTAFGTEGVDGMEGITLGESQALFHANCRARNEATPIAATPAARSQQHRSWRRRHRLTGCRTARSCR